MKTLRRVGVVVLCVLPCAALGLLLGVGVAGAVTGPTVDGAAIGTTPYFSDFEAMGGNGTSGFLAYCGPGYFEVNQSPGYCPSAGPGAQDSNAQSVLGGASPIAGCGSTDNASAPTPFVDPTGYELAVCGGTGNFGTNIGGDAVQDFVAVPGAVYTLSAEVYLPSGVAVSSQAVSSANWGFCAATADFMCASDLGVTSAGLSTGLTAGQWAAVSLTFTADLGANVVQVDLAGGWTSCASGCSSAQKSGHEIYYDDVSLSEADTGQTAGLCGEAGATSQTPWCYQGTAGGQTTTSAATPQWGECNEDYVFPTKADGYSQGYSIQLGCQMMIPAGDTPDLVVPSMGCGTVGGSWSGSGWSEAGACGETGFEGMDVPSSGFNLVAPVSGSGSCTPSWNNGLKGPNIFVGALSSHPLDCTYLGLPDDGTFVSTNTSEGPFCWGDYATVDSAQYGAVFQAANTDDYRSTQFIETFNVAGSAECGTSFATGPLFEPSAVGVPTDACPTSAAMVNQYDSSDWWGLQEMNGQNPGSNSPQVRLDSSSDGSSPWGPSLMLDTVTCSYGNPSVIQVGVPSDYGAGGAPTTGGTAGTTGPACTLDGVSGATSSIDETAGDQAGVTFTYSGEVDQIAINPGGGNDVSTGNAIGPDQSIGTVGTVTLGGDATIVPGTSSPQTVSVHELNTGTFNPTFYCVAAGLVYNWGDASGGNPLTDQPIVDAVGGTTSNLDDCFASAGWSLYDPVSWVTGALHDGVCIAQYLFLPQGFDVSTLSAPFVDHVPGSWVADATGALTALFSGVTSGIAGGACSAPVITAPFSTLTQVGGAPDFKVYLPSPSSDDCSGSSTIGGTAGAGDLFGYRAVVRDVLEVAVWFSVFVLGWKMMPWSRESDGSELFRNGTFVTDAAGNQAFEMEGGRDY